MSELTEKMTEISESILDTANLSKCLYQSVDLCQRDNINELSHVLPLAKIIADKHDKLFVDYDELENLIYKNFIYN